MDKKYPEVTYRCWAGSTASSAAARRTAVSTAGARMSSNSINTQVVDRSSGRFHFLCGLGGI